MHSSRRIRTLTQTALVTAALTAGMIAAPRTFAQTSQIDNPDWPLRSSDIHWPAGHTPADGIEVKGDTGTIGITDYAQNELSDIVSVDLPAVGTKLMAGKMFGSVESLKTESEIYAPVSGEVVAVNTTLQDKPETINNDPHRAGWLIKIKLANPAEVDALMDAAAYEAFIAENKKEASA